MVSRNKTRTCRQERHRSILKSTPSTSNTDIDAYLVTTKLAKIRRSSLLIPTEDAFVRGVLHNIGRDGSPYWSHAYSLSRSMLIYRVCEWVLGYLSVLVGGREGSVVAGINKRMHENIRRRALRKAAKSK
jgi:17beta-estradiol 17-dehydrogenase / very-long-chain 3-oxoacyl-CoA reductase